jgi:hypothetical protein
LLDAVAVVRHREVRRRREDAMVVLCGRVALEVGNNDGFGFLMFSLLSDSKEEEVSFGS